MAQHPHMPERGEMRHPNPGEAFIGSKTLGSCCELARCRPCARMVAWQRQHVGMLSVQVMQASIARYVGFSLKICGLPSLDTWASIVTYAGFHRTMCGLPPLSMRAICHTGTFTILMRGLGVLRGWAGSHALRRAPLQCQADLAVWTRVVQKACARFYSCYTSAVGISSAAGMRGDMRRDDGKKKINGRMGPQASAEAGSLGWR
eukprot:363879-Chlamydomonas_euryale.AAC.9